MLPAGEPLELYLLLDNLLEKRGQDRNEKGLLFLTKRSPLLQLHLLLSLS